MKKKLLAVLLAGVLTVGTAVLPQAMPWTVTGQAEDTVSQPENVITSGDWQYYIDEEVGGAVLSKYSKEFFVADELIIPDYIDGVKVVGLGESFIIAGNYKVLTIPATVTNIHENAFLNVTANNYMVDTNNPNYCSQDGVIFNKEKTRIIEFPRGNTGSYTIPNSVVSIGEYAFNDARIKSLTIPSSTIDINYKSFGFYWLDEMNVDPNNEAFSSEDGILYNKDKTELLFFPRGKTVSDEYPNSLKTIGEGAFSVIDNLVEIKIPEGVETIEQDAFGGCHNLTTVIFPSSLKTIKSFAFSSCSSLKNVNIPNNVEYLDSDAFAFCDNITTATIPSTVSSVPFDECPNLERIDVNPVDGDNSKYSSQDGVLYNADKTELLRYPPAKQDEVFEFPNELRSFDSWAFEYCKYLKTIIMSDSCTPSISGFELRNCSSIKEINVGENNPEYSSENGILFNKNKTELIKYPPAKEETTYIVPENVSNLAWSSFDNCLYLEKITLPDQITNIGYNFWACKALSEITMPKIENIVKSAFSNCYAIKKVYYGGTVEDWNNIHYASPYGGAVITGLHIFHGCEIICTDGTIVEPPIEGQPVPDEPSEPETPDEPESSGGSSSSGSSSSGSSSSSSDSTSDDEPAYFIDKDTGVIATADAGVLPDGAKLAITPVADETNDAQITYDISFTDENGEEIQPNGNVTVKIVIPEKFKNAEKIYVYREESDGTYTDMKATIEDSMIVFTTDHFSRYILTADEITAPAETPAPETTTSAPSGGTTKPTNPYTGVPTAFIPIAVTAIVSGAIVVATRKRK